MSLKKINKNFKILKNLNKYYNYDIELLKELSRKVTIKTKLELDSIKILTLE